MKPTVAAEAVEAEIPTIEREDDIEILSFGEVDQRGIRQLRFDISILSEKGSDPRCSLFPKRRDRNFSRIYPDEHVLNGFRSRSEQPRGFGKNRPAGKKG